MKNYNFKITFENDDLDIIEAQDFLAQVENYISHLCNDKRYDIALTIAERK